MSTYARPHIEQVTFTDAEGKLIDYGNRWIDGLPDDSYSVVEHRERFLPLHTVATALIDYLTSTYDVVTEEGHQVALGLANALNAEDIVHAIRLTPRSTGCSPMVVILTNAPAIQVCAGNYFSANYPGCGCNACDENWTTAADEFEWQTLSIVDGGLTEEVSEPRRKKWTFDRGRGFVQGMGQTVTARLRAADGSTEQSAVSRAEDAPAAQLERIRTKFAELTSLGSDGNWLPWHLR